MRRRDFTIGLLLASTIPPAWAQAPTKQHRIAIIIPAGPVARINDPASRFYQASWQELARLGDVEGRNLTVNRYSGEGRPEGYTDLARKVVNQNPEAIFALTDDIARAVRTANATIPIVWMGGDPIQAGLATSLAHPGGNITGVTVYSGIEILAKRLQILKEADPSASRIAFLNMHELRESFEKQQLHEASRRLQISVIDVPMEAATRSEVQRAFAEIANTRTDAIVVGSNGSLIPFRDLIIALAAKAHLPAMYPWREYVDVGGLIAYASDLRELGRRLADGVHQVLNGTKPADIPIFRPAKFELAVNLRTAKALGLAIPPVLLAAADAVIE